MPLPNHPEPLTALRARFALALAATIDAEAVEAGLVDRPGQQRQHVFDFLNGLRLIVSRDRHPDGTRYLHVSASAFGLTEAQIRSGVLEPPGFLALVRAAYRELSDDRRELPLVGFSEKGVPHFLRAEES